MGHAHLQHAGVANHDQAGNRCEVAVGENAGSLFRPDASAITGNQGDGRQHGVVHVH